MRSKSNTKTEGEARGKKPRKARHTRHFYKTASYLDTIGLTAEQTALCADVLTAWTRFMLDADPTAAGTIYRALGDAWEANRAAGDGDDNERERLTVTFHGAFLDRLGEVRGEDRSKTAACIKHERGLRERLAELMAATFDQMRARVPQAAAAAGEGGTVAPGLRPGRDHKSEIGETIFAPFGLLKGDVAEWEGTRAPRRGDVVRFFMKGQSANTISRFVSTEGGRLTLMETEGEEYEINLADVEWLCRLKSVTRTTLISRADPATDAAPGDAPAPVIHLGAWLDSHPRPVRNLLFAEKQD